tara:strand:+ start:15 stop:758 length:744 start_codon:yes stop_codon:yes gene_type:complete
MKVFTLLFSRSQDYYGNLLFFDTVRQAFPKAEINVISNANSSKFDSIAEDKCLSVNANFYTLDKEITHEHFIEHLITTEEEDFYLIDPDTIWFEEMPWDLDTAIAGRYIPNYYCQNWEAFTHDRLHTSCFFVSPKRLNSLLSNSKHSVEFNLVAPFVYYVDGQRMRFDTCSQLFHFLKPYNQALTFDEELNSKFCHLFCGTHLEFIEEGMRHSLVKMHQHALSGVENAKQLVHMQNEYFKAHSWERC